MFDSALRRTYRWQLNQRCRASDRTQLSRSAIVFAPHPDDETLGCGGTILQKKAVGASIKIVFMTDGSQSHGGLIQPEELKAIRAQEALAAAAKLGVPEADVFALGFQDSTLTQHRTEALQKVMQILFKVFPEEVYVPYGQDGIPDHDATQQIVTLAVRQWGLATTVYEYPVWFWHHRPWIVERAASAAQPQGQTAVASPSQASRTAARRLLREFQWVVDIQDVRDRKRQALEQHRSQMTRLKPVPQWSTLADVAQGQFLDCFFQPYEVFRRYRLN
ncbi:MAG: PIG-L family deacetylase [Nodosilinea sp.]